MRVYRPLTSVSAFRPAGWQGSRRALGKGSRAGSGEARGAADFARNFDLSLRSFDRPDPARDVPAAPGEKFRRFRVIARARRIHGIKRGVDYRRFWLTLLRGNFAGAEQQVAELLHCYRPQQLYLRLFVPSLTLSGTMFALGRITFRDEHRITWGCLRLMRSVRGVMNQSPRNGLFALATGVGQDSHRIGLRMVCDLLGAVGWQVRFLDTNERGTLRDALRGRQTDAILISIGRAEEFEQARRLIAEARRAGFTGTVAVGGRAVALDPMAVEKLGADLTAANGTDLARKLTLSCRAHREVGAIEARENTRAAGDAPETARVA